MTINQRAKGARGEREWRDVLRSLGFTAAERGCQHAGGPDSPDVKNGIPNTHCEVKWVEKLNIWKALEQAERDAGEDLIPYVAFKRNRTEWYVAIPARRIEEFAMNVICDPDSMGHYETREDIGMVEDVIEEPRGLV